MGSQNNIITNSLRDAYINLLFKEKKILNQGDICYYNVAVYVLHVLANETPSGIIFYIRINMETYINTMLALGTGHILNIPEYALQRTRILQFSDTNCR